MAPRLKRAGGAAPMFFRQRKSDPGEVAAMRHCQSFLLAASAAMSP